MRFGVLGRLVVDDGTGERPLAAVKLRALLAVLLLHADQPVPIDRIVDALWDGEPPASATASLHNLVLRLRRVLGDLQAERLVNTSRGYLLRVGEDGLDSARFERHLGRARAAVQAGAWESVHSETTAALALWRGEPLADLPDLTAAGPAREQWQEARLQALEWRLEAELSAGQAAGLVAELTRLTAEQPLREAFHHQLMLALHRAGRGAEALAAYQRLRRTTIDELGIEPGPRARQIQQEILRSGPGTPARPAPTAPGPAPAPTTGPNQLPADTADFTGRTAELELLRGRLTAAADGQGSPVVGVSGMGGVGKTTLAVHAAYGVRELFPDGLLHVDLRGFGSGERRAAHDVLARLLADLGHSGGPLPEHTDDRSALLRSVLAGRRVLLVLDNARDTEQVLPLLPGSGRSAALVTSRSTLPDLPGGQVVRLEPMDVEEQRLLLSTVCGEERVAADPDGALRLLAAAAGLPLALRIVAARLAARPAWPAGALAERLTDGGRRLRSLTAGRLAVRDAFAGSYLALRDGVDPAEREAARAFRLLGLWPGLAFSQEAAAALLGRPTTDTADLLDLLADLHLLQSPEPRRHGFHDLVGEYAAELAAEEETAEDRDAARVRLAVWYTAALEQARKAMSGGSAIVSVVVDRPATPLPTFTDGEEARAWCVREVVHVGELIRRTADTSRPDLGWRMASGLAGYAATHWWTGEYQACLRLALESATAHGDVLGQAVTLNGIATCHGLAGQLSRAVENLRSSLALAEQVERDDLVSIVLGNLTVAHAELGDGAEALVHAQRAFELAPAGSRQTVLLSATARAYMQLGDHRAAEVRLREVAQVWREHGNLSALAVVQANLGEALGFLGRRDEAFAALAEALAINENIGNTANVADCLVITGRTHRHFGEWAAARTSFRQALEIALDFGLPSWIDQAQDGLSSLPRSPALGDGGA